MKISRRASRVALVAACLALIPTFAFAAEGPIEIEFGPDLIEWFPNTEWKLGHLTITGPNCLNFQYEFHREDRIVFKPYTPEGNPLPDGVYSFDLQLGPGAEVRGLNEEYGQGQLCRGRADLPPLSVLTSSGYVAVVDKRFVDPFKEEDRFAEEGLNAAGSEGGEPVAMGSPGMVLAGDDFMNDQPQSMSAKQVITGDLVVYNSICVGFDCPTNPSFGADTIRLQENNLRIHFDDTSTAASFPNRDWRIVANDSANGGASKFSIDDATAGRTPFTIEGNAPSHSLYVDDGGRVGLGTSTPVVELHVKDGDTPALRLEQDTSSGFAAQTWDVAGNETSFFVRDATNGSTLPFRIQPGASSNTVFIDNNSEVGIGTSSPQARLHVRRTDGTAQALVEEASGTAMQRTLLQLTNNGGTEFRMTDSSTSVTWLFQNTGGNFRFTDAGDAFNELILTADGDLTVTGDVFSATCTSPGNPCAPDYVFADDYPLMSLDALEQFIAENKHLPNVPSEKDFEEQRKINLGQFQMTLLEKIEELTLYTIQQRKLIDELAAQNAELAEAVGALQQR